MESLQKEIKGRTVEKEIIVSIKLKRIESNYYG
jgi:hypothetical protein